MTKLILFLAWLGGYTSSYAIEPECERFLIVKYIYSAKMLPDEALIAFYQILGIQLREGKFVEFNRIVLPICGRELRRRLPILWGDHIEEAKRALREYQDLEKGE